MVYYDHETNDTNNSLESNCRSLYSTFVRQPYNCKYTNDSKDYRRYGKKLGNVYGIAYAKDDD